MEYPTFVDIGDYALGIFKANNDAYINTKLLKVGGRWGWGLWQHLIWKWLQVLAWMSRLVAWSLTHMENVSRCNDKCWAVWVFVRCGKTLTLQISRTL